jgi:DNA polymerase (family 10)
MAFSFTNQDLAKLFRSVAAAYIARRGDRFRIIAYQRAADSIEHATSEVKDLWDDGKLGELAGIGSGIAGHLDELFRTGRVKHFEEVMAGLPPAMFELLRVPGIGAKTAYTLAKELQISPKAALSQLEKAAREGRIRGLEGFGQKSEADILLGIEEFKKGQIKGQRMLLPYADSLAQELIDYLYLCSAVVRADPLGSLRRLVSTVGDIDIGVATNKPKEVLDHFARYPKVKRILGRGEKALCRVILKSGHQVDLRLQKPSAYGAMLQYFTGSKHHNIALREFALKKGLSLSEYGIKIKNEKSKIKNYAAEENFYHALGLEWIPPEIREDSREIEAALRQAQGKPDGLPKLVELKDIKGDLHIHSDFPIGTSHDEGLDSITTILEKARQLNYQYLGFAEHNPSTSRHSENQVIDLLRRKKEIIEQLKYSRGRNLPVYPLNGLEIDIKPNGNLALPENGLELLDYAIASVHSSFRMARSEMTKRVILALSHPKVWILGHPTGRKLGQREGYELDWEKIFDFCLENDKILEICSWPDRLDLPDTLVREAVKRGVRLIIDTDSHAVEHLELMRYGVAVARRGWAESQDIINTLPLTDFIAILLRAGD